MRDLFTTIGTRYLIATLNHDASLAHLLNPDERIKRILEAHTRRQQLDGQMKIDD